MNIQNKIKEAYGDSYDILKDQIDENGWCRLSVLTPKNLIQKIRSEKDFFQSRVENTPDYFVTYFRPISLIELL